MLGEIVWSVESADLEASVVGSRCRRNRVYLVLDVGRLSIYFSVESPMEFWVTPVIRMVLDILH